jgi:Divergent InlB B-repeat domain
MALLVFAGALAASTAGGQAQHTTTRAHPHTIPAALVRAIHARLGPGPIALGHAPLIAGIEPAAGGWKVNASAQALAAHIAPDGMVSAHLAGSDAASLTPVALSSGGTFARLSSGRALFKDGRLLVRLGPAGDTYQVTAGGLEQRFMVNRALSRNAQQLTLGFSSPVRWRTIRGGSAIVPTGDGDGRLAYAGLRVTDARGRVLPSHFALAARGPEIVTDTNNAAYPVTIDPTWTTTSVPTATLHLGLDDGYATALSQDGTTALVGADGAAYIFRSSAGSWSSSSIPVATLTDGSDSGDEVPDGSAVALSPDGATALIGYPGADGGYGVAYVFQAPTTEASWVSSSTPTATLKDQSGGLFGSSVALSSDATTALIGAISVNSGAGAAYVFDDASEGALTTSSVPTATLTSSAPVGGDQIGSAVSLSADGLTALVGADGVNSGTGAAYVFHVASETSWTGSISSPTRTLTNGSGSDGDGLGSSAALSSDGTTALITAGGAGAAYVYQASAADAWASAPNTAPTATLTDSNVSGLGAAVALSNNGTTALVGASGAADVFHVSTETSWTGSISPAATLTDSNESNLGSSVALSSDGATALVGAPSAADVFVSGSGQGSWGSLTAPAATLTGPSGDPSGGYGYSLALSSDGTTALVGAKGAAYIFQTSSSWAASSAVVATLVGASGSSAFASVALSSDGTTALIGESDADGGAGAAYIFHASTEDSWASNPAPSATLTNTPSTSTDGLGKSVALASDGQLALVGAPGVNSGAGAVYVFYVSSVGLWTGSISNPTATLISSSPSASDQLGSAVALSSDGTTALTSAPGKNAAYVFQATGENAWASAPTTPIATLTNGSSSLGSAIALSGDGKTALFGASSANFSAGAAYLYHVSSEQSWESSTAPTATLTKSSNFYDQLGSAVALSSDGTIALIGADGVNNNDGVSDTGTGAAFVFQVSSADSWASSPTPTATLTNESGAYGDLLGSSVALTPDGATALAGAYPANSGAGGAYVFLPPSTTYTLTAATNGTGTGTVTSVDGGINCGSTCTSSYGSGSQVTLNAQPGLNSTFTGWSGDGCSGTGSCTAPISQDTTVTATFTYVAPPPSLTVELTGTAGSVSSSPAGISCPGTCGADFTPGTVVTLTATPASGATFAGWSSPSCEVTITGACSVTTTAPPQTVSATFTTATVLPQEGLRVSLAGTGTGSVSSSPTGISCPGTCTSSFAQGTVVTLTPSPASGTTFAGWSGAGCSGFGTCNVSMSSAQTVTATYTAASAKPSCTLVPQGAKVSVPAKPSKKHPLSAALKVVARCDQSASVKLAGTITAAQKHGKSKTFTISAVKAKVAAGKTDTIHRQAAEVGAHCSRGRSP